MNHMRHGPKILPKIADGDAAERQGIVRRRLAEESATIRPMHLANRPIGKATSTVIMATTTARMMITIRKKRKGLGYGR